MGQANGSQKGREMKNTPAAARPKSKRKSPRRKPQLVGWRRLPQRQRARILQIGVWVFVAIFVLSIAGGMMLTYISKVPGK